jgi:Mrp family chromosome partitioning ATPase
MTEPVTIERRHQVPEPFRALRAAIEARRADLNQPAVVRPGQARRDLRVISVVGIEVPVAAVARGLAESFAAGQESTLYVDVAALRGGRAMARKAGLAEWLSAARSTMLPDVVPGRQPMLDVVPPGNAEALAGDPIPEDRWQTLLSLARESYRWTVVHVPPLVSSADGLLLARLVDGIALVVVPRHTTGPAAIQARDALVNAGGHLLGVVLADKSR